jgi:hypothetical protein
VLYEKLSFIRLLVANKVDENHLMAVRSSYDLGRGNIMFAVNTEATMVIQMTRTRTIHDVQADFNKAYPFLRLEFYGRADTRNGFEARKKFHVSTLLEKIGLSREGEFMIVDQMTVGQLEKIFSDIFGTKVQVSRQSGSVWLETTMTDGWTLFQQNEHGRELSSAPVTTPDDQYIDPS